jgi:hypothetical protein
MRSLRISDCARWPGRRGVKRKSLLIQIANVYKANRNSPSNMPIELETARRRHGCSGSTQAMPPDSSKAFEILQTTSRSLDDRIHKPISSSSCTTGCAIKRKGSGLLYWIMLTILASSSLQAPIRMGTRTAEKAGTHGRSYYNLRSIRMDLLS